MSGHVVACLIAVIASLAVSYAAVEMDPEMLEMASIVRSNCADETEVDLSLVEKVNKGADLTPDDKLKCYMKCTMETVGMMNEGVVDVDTVLGMLPSELAKRNENMLRQCGTQQGVDHCDTAYRTQVCWQNANKADYYLI